MHVRTDSRSRSGGRRRTYVSLAHNVGEAGPMGTKRARPVAFTRLGNAEELDDQTVRGMRDALDRYLQKRLAAKGAAESASAAATVPMSAVEEVARQVRRREPELRMLASRDAGLRAVVEPVWTGLVTGPIHKARLAARGFAFRGHTDFLAHLCGVPAHAEVMAFHGPRFGLALVTTHIPLAAVPAAVTPARVARVARVAAAAWRDQLGLAAPRLLVCGLNPHAGEGGLLGTEDRDVLAPACDALRAEGLHLLGPVSAETAVHEALAGHGDVVVAMYHDQGLVPLKALDFGRTVNWTLGLPLLRTSVDHGTADDLVGTGRADPASMGAAIDLARRIAGRRG